MSFTHLHNSIQRPVMHCILNVFSPAMLRRLTPYWDVGIVVSIKTTISNEAVNPSLFKGT